LLGAYSATNATTGELISTGSMTIYTGSLLTYLSEQESGVIKTFTTTYTKLYSGFSTVGLTILKSPEYQILVCRWAIKDESLLSQLQKEKTTLMTSLKKDFVDLESQILTLEEKKRLLQQDKLNVFDAGATYEIGKNMLKSLIDTKVHLYTWMIQTFDINYTSKITNFLTNYQQYLTANKESLKALQEKLTKVQNITTAFEEIDTIVTTINTKVTWLDDSIPKVESAKNKWMLLLDTTLQSLIETTIKRNKKIPNLNDELMRQKSYVVGQYQMDLDEYLTNIFQNRYNRNQYLTLKNQVRIFSTKFYTTTNQLNCTNILAALDDDSTILANIRTMKSVVNSWLVKLEKEGISTAFKNQIYSGFQSIYLQKYKQRYIEYQNYIKDYLKGSITTNKNIPVSTGSIGNSIPSIQTSKPYIFTKPFKIGQYDIGIKALQNILTKLQLYSGAIDGIYHKATIQAVYSFQLDKWLLKWYEKKPATWWRMWPATRNALNQLTK